MSFWDCGEYIACSYILGIAHPPGNPLFLLIGRVFSLLPIAGDIAHRVNLVSVFSGAVAATFGYAVSVRLLRFLPGIDESRPKLVLAYLCSMAGALLFAFSRTNWSNSVEAEVYSIAMLIYFALIYLTLKWYDNRESGAGWRYLIAIAYLSVLSVAVHMTTFLSMPAIFLFVILVDERLRRDWRFWVSGIVLFLVAVNVSWFLIAVPLWALISLVYFFKERSAGWGLSLGLTVAAMIGFSAHGYIPIRAAQEPRINQNNPADWERFYGYLQRKQYGQESMFEKMFHRRASWSHQFGDYPRIGFGGFLMDQFGFGGILFVVPFILAIIGIVALVKWKWRPGLFFLLILLAGTIGLVLYMNFSDGSQMDPLTGMDRLEVRDRDYFFTPGFITFGLCIGIGLFVALGWLIDKLRLGRSLPVAAAAGLLSLVFPFVALSANYHLNDRSDNFMPYDYAYNYLGSCPPDAILFTSGDNDTFPLWCLQEVYGFRRDVKIANLSLIQTDWYQLQLKHQMGVPISFTDEQMIWESIATTRPLRPYVDHLRGGWEHLLMAFKDPETKQLVTVADQMVENIIGANQWKYPIVFSGELPRQVRYPISEHSSRLGYLIPINKEPMRGVWEVEGSMELFRNYRARGLDDLNVYRDEVATTLAIGSMQMGIEFIDYLKRNQQPEKALELAELFIRQYPEFWQFYAVLGDLRNYSKEQIDSTLNAYLPYCEKLIQSNPENIFYYQYKALALNTLGRPAEAIAASEQAYRIHPASAITYRSLLSLYAQNGQREDAMRISREFLVSNPNDQTARAVAAGQF